MLKEKIYFIAAIGTDLGKTFLVENLCKIIPTSSAIKPIASGFKDGDKDCDSVKILSSIGLEASLENINAITPWRFEEAISPHYAAKNSGMEINFSEVKKFCNQKILTAKKEDKFLFIEAAGGVMTPINDSNTFLDLAAELQIPLLLLSANYLGSISHTLSAIKALESENIAIEAVLINDELPSCSKSLPSMVDTIKKFSSIKTVLLSEFLGQF